MLLELKWCSKITFFLNVWSVSNGINLGNFHQLEVVGRVSETELEVSRK